MPLTVPYTCFGSASECNTDISSSSSSSSDTRQYDESRHLSGDQQLQQQQQQLWWRRRRQQRQQTLHERHNRILQDCCIAQGRCTHLQLEHECGFEDLSHVSKGDARLLRIQVLREELQAQLEEPPPAKG